MVRTLIKRKPQICPQIQLAILPINTTELQTTLRPQNLQPRQRKTVPHPLSIRAQRKEQNPSSLVTGSPIDPNPDIGGLEGQLEDFDEAISLQKFDGLRLVPSKTFSWWTKILERGAGMATVVDLHSPMGYTATRIIGVG
jgi:hypothetical protein